MKNLLALTILVLFSANAYAVLGGCTDTKLAEQKLLKVVKKKTLPQMIKLKNPNSIKPDSLFLSKSTRQLFLLKKEKAYKVYTVVLGKDPIGAKLREGDNRTPEGQYKIDWRNSNSKFHLSLHIDYPRREDIERAKDLGYDAGGAIMIHGEPNYMDVAADYLSLDDTEKADQLVRNLLYLFDWTSGCVAVRNNEIEELFEVVKNGTPIWIQP
ncbi:MAG: L,D-transpeptidase family protein [Bacteriovoracaceae bacterium]|nr:L,D-transpeptidase family protein [Bacteriovoracaceae bacterium]